MKFIYTLILLSVSSNLFAFRLNTNISAGFSETTVKIYVTSNSTCTQAGLTNTELLDIAMDGADDFWNKVPTSNLRIKSGGILTTTDSKFLTEKLCASDSETTCDANTTVPTVNDIVIACNNDTSENFPTSDFLALSAPTNLSGGNIKGSIILINDSSNSLFSGLSRGEKVSVLAHEIGHAIGLGHSNKNEALMYFQNSDKLSKLSQDDIDGVTYLYPNKLDGCTGILGGTINFDDSKKQNSNTFPISLLIGLSTGFLLLIFAKFLHAFKERMDIFPQFK